MTLRFFEHPILNAPYDYPAQHWELDLDGQPTGKIASKRRPSSYVTPVPRPSRRRGTLKQEPTLLFDTISTADQTYDTNAILNKIRQEVDEWRRLSEPAQWLVTPETARLLQHWRHYSFQGVRPFFCQVEAVETAIWLAEVAPKRARWALEYLHRANESANPELFRIAFKLATGAGKTTVMAMLMAWQVVKPDSSDEGELKGDDLTEAKQNNEAARLWITGIETVKRILGVPVVYDLSATPFFLRGSGYAEGTLFPWTASDFSLMDAIECGIVKLPRVPVADNIPGGESPKFRNLWEYIGKKMPRKGRGTSGKTLDPLSLPTELQTALEALYGHYQNTFALWQDAGVTVPPVFIVVCNNTSTSKLVYDYISGFNQEGEEGESTYNAGRLELFRNYDEHGSRLPRPRTLLIDSAQLDSDEALDADFRTLASDEIDRFRREMVARTGDRQAADTLSDAELLREVMNTVGKPGQLGESIRCVVSVSMLTEGWDANTVTHVLGIRAFGTQLLCEQVVGRALRRQSYDLNEAGLFNVEYADVLGIPFDFTAQPVVAKPAPPRETIRVQAVRPERDGLEILFPRVEGYRVELPNEQLTARFSPDSALILSPDMVGPSITRNQGILGEGVDLTLKHLQEMRQSTLLFYLAKRLLYTKYRDPGEEPKLYLFGQLKRITRQWLEGGHLQCVGGTYLAQLLYQEIADLACEKIKSAITASLVGDLPVKAILDPYNPTGSTRFVHFTTSKQSRWKTDPRRCHINWVVCDSDWEAEFCRVAEAHPLVQAYVKNQGLGLEVPYLMGSTRRKYLPDFIVQIDDGHDDPLHLVVEIKGFRGENAKEKANTMQVYWVPGVNNLGKFGRWVFAEFTAVFEIQAEFDRLVTAFVTGQNGIREPK
ncbi:MAG: hypothetical protein HQM06_08325 [Magnetococcales bacterium]|nr:hypothetical protein [Magnetococcales bacterium]